MVGGAVSPLYGQVWKESHGFHNEDSYSNYSIIYIYNYMYSYIYIIILYLFNSGT